MANEPVNLSARESGAGFCAMLRTKFSYFRAPGGARLIDPASATACYTCMRTQRPFGPDDRPAGADSCRGADRACFVTED
ncbi:hypothetical protein IMX07_07335 [bacterium]|nr:hypothetical protein [bacterium]